MDHYSNNLYPDCPVVERTLEMGAWTENELFVKLAEHNLQLNDFAKKLLKSSRFTVSEKPYRLQTIELQVSNLGFLNGATLPQLFGQAKRLGLCLCPLEVGPLLRLYEKNQSEGARDKPLTKNRGCYVASRLYL